jgi:acyl carrier protein
MNGARPVSESGAPTDGVSLPDAFLALAADVFGVDVETLSPATSYGSIEGWDSVNHLRLVMETEARFGKPIPLEAVPALRTLADFGEYCQGKGESKCVK